MSGYLLFVSSTPAMGGSLGKAVAKQPGARIVPQWELTAADIAGARGLITTMHLDQLGLMEFAAEIAAFLARGGRWFFNGHMLRPFVPELGQYVPLVKPGQKGLFLTTLAPHPVFDGIEREGMSSRKGVAGFYGRGYNPMPEGATAVTGVGVDRMPVDWDWALPGGGRIFSHAGNDLPGNAEGQENVARLAANVVAWTMEKEGVSV